MIYLTLFWEFLKIGLFAIGGGAATLPFLMDLTEKFDWFTMAELTDMIAISESTPGPLGINMATYAGYHAAGILGGVVATVGLIFPSIVIIELIARFLSSYGKSPIVQGVFEGIRPGVTALITAAVIGLFGVTLVTVESGGVVFHWIEIAIFAVSFGLMQIKPLKKLHPLVWIALGAAAGILLKL